MPYRHNKDLPADLRRLLPPHAQDIFRAAFNAAWERYGADGHADRDEVAHRVAWAAVKHSYRKQDGAWLPIARA